MAAGGSINHPKSAQARSKRKGGKISKKKKQKKKINVDPLTTSHIIKKTRTNPNANITLSGKKRRLLLKELKREEQDKKRMDVEVVDKPKAEISKKVRHTDTIEKMDMT
ncbi:uncharacterized protein C11orf98 homolog [Dendronephthya gigantea]|uniref:uncharacterized protein C11orf98 homolog n=1 Tax=Dendronephthya gigantea TaxID=151771 RepID=UPI00106D032A|nr:uncharacterized protein C11orf98 homolog [Dendronephthya gigantea]